MQLRHQLNFWANTEDVEAFEKIGISLNEGHQRLLITEDDPRWPAVSELIEGMDVVNAVGSVFSKQEYDKASVLALRTNEVKYPQPEDDYFRFTFSEKSGCPGVDRASDEMGRIKGCGSGYVQTSPFRLKSLPKMEKLHIFGLHWQFDALFLRRDIYEQYFQPLGLLLELSGGLQLYVTIGEDTTEIYCSLTRKYDNDALVMMTISDGTWR